jgi:hypothetical protein
MPRVQFGFWLFVLFVSLVLSTPAAAQTWTEAGDAGDLVPSAQYTLGAGGLSTINGALGSPTDVDLYCVTLNSTPPGGTVLVYLNCVVIQGPNVWLFDSAGNGVATDMTCMGGNKTILAPTGSLVPGFYYVAVSYYGVDPYSASGAIWLPALGGLRVPDGPGAAGTLTSWAGAPNVQPLNPYTIGVNSDYFGYCDAPTPADASTWGTLKARYGS